MSFADLDKRATQLQSGPQSGGHKRGDDNHLTQKPPTTSKPLPAQALGGGVSDGRRNPRD